MFAGMTKPSGNHGQLTPDLFPDHQLAIIGQRVIDFWPILARRRPVVVATCEDGDEIEEFVGDGVTVISPEWLEARRRQWTNRSVGDLVTRAVPALNRALSDSVNHFVVFPYCATAEMDAYSRDRAMRVAAIRAELKARLDDKIWMRSQLKALGLAVPNHVTLSGGIPRYSDLRCRLGARFIVQSRVGSAGIGTYDIGCESDLELLGPRLGNDAWLASEYVGDTTVNIHGLIADAVELSPPSIQLSGVPELVGVRHGYCGNDFGAVAELPTAVVNSCRALARSIGVWLKSEGYLGIFGVDFACDDDRVRVLEVNPRLQGSSWLLADVEERSGKLSLIVKHVLAYLGADWPNDAGTDVDLSAAQGILHLRSDVAHVVSHTLRCGTYELGPDNSLIFRRRPSWPLTLSSTEVFLFGLPGNNTIIDAGAVSARFACSFRITDRTGRHLLSLA
jgi:predicted ATP-grasp superfamily ATP-dependent carboligase